MKIRIHALAVVAFLAGTLPLGADVITIVNSGFETDTVANNDYNSSITPAGWATYDPTGVLDRPLYNDVGVLNPTGSTLYPGGAPEGSNVALIFLTPTDPSDFNQPVGLQQTLSATLLASTRYLLSVQVGNIAPVGGDFDFTGFPGYRVELLAGSNLLAQDHNTLSIDEGSFGLSTLEFTTGAAHPALGESLTIRLLNLNLPNSGIEVNFDDVQLTATAVPEPATWALIFGAASLGLAAFKRRARPVR